MRNLAILAVLGLAACGENTGWNPNYSAMHNGSAYADYLQKREAALHGRGAVPDAIPVQLPAQAPTAADIAGTRAKTPGTVTVKAAAVVPAQPVSAGPTPLLVRYAHQESQNPGQVKYPRTGGTVGSAERACRGYAGADAAQTAFIAAGGPVIDPKGLDPDGDGFVCGWDPRPFRQSRL